MFQKTVFKLSPLNTDHKCTAAPQKNCYKLRISTGGMKHIVSNLDLDYRYIHINKIPHVFLSYINCLDGPGCCISGKIALPGLLFFPLDRLFCFV